MVQAALQKIIYLIIGIGVIVILVLFVTSQTPLTNFLLGKGWTIGNQELNDKQTIIFSDFKNVINTCVTSNKNNCFCQNQKVIFATTYYLKIENPIEINYFTRISLLSDKKQQLSTFDVNINGCILMNGISNDKITDPALIKYGQKPQIEYKRIKSDVNLDYLFYKRNNELCIVDKKNLQNLDINSAC